jgi:hypothetical protein
MDTTIRESAQAATRDFLFCSGKSGDQRWQVPYRFGSLHQPYFNVILSLHKACSATLVRALLFLVCTFRSHEGFAALVLLLDLFPSCRCHPPPFRKLGSSYMRAVYFRISVAPDVSLESSTRSHVMSTVVHQMIRMVATHLHTADLFCGVAATMHTPTAQVIRRHVWNT